MKKYLCIVFSLVLAVSLLMVPAAPAAVSANSGGGVELQSYGNGTAQWSADTANSGSYSVKLDTGIEPWNDWAEVSIPVDIPLKDISSLSFWKMVVAGYCSPASYPCGWNPGIMLAIDADGNGSFDGDINLAGSLGGDAYVAGEFTKGLTEYDSAFVLVDACNDMAWWGADSTGWSPYYGSLSGFQAEYWGEIDPDDHVKLIKIVIGSTGSWMDETVYVDDLTINGVPYELEQPAAVWVATDGNDANPGTEAKPFLTIQHAIDILAGDCAVNVAAGMYNEAVTIEKELTLLGANAGVNPVTGTRSDESIIDGTGLVVNHLVDIPEASTVFDGFTVQNAPSFGIVARSLTPTITNNNSTIRNNIVDNTRLGIILNIVSGVTVADNLITSSLVDGIYLDGAVYDSVISGNKITGCMRTSEGAITFEYGNDFANIAIENNIIEDNAGSGIYFWYHPAQLTTLTGIEIHYNNIVNNGSGVLNEISTSVDAINNWWGQSSGPGDAISLNVDAEPWLLTKGGEQYNRTVALNSGWTIVSPDAELASHSIIASGTVMVLAYGYTEDADGELVGAFTTDFSLDPITPVFIKTAASGGIGFNYVKDSLGMFTTNLEVGWNLIGVPETNATTGAMLSPLRYGAGSEIALATLASQGSYNPGADSFYRDMTGEWGELPTLYPFDGYWAYMNVAKEFGVVVVE